MNDPYYAKWAKIMKDLETGEFAPESLDPRDISVQFGQPLTEEQFKNRTVGGQPVHVIKPGQANGSFDPANGSFGPANGSFGPDKDPRAALKAKIDAMAKSRSGK